MDSLKVLIKILMDQILYACIRILAKILTLYILPEFFFYIA